MTELSSPANVVTFAEASAIVAAHAASIRGRPREGSSERVPLAAALGRVLASPIAADRDQPAFRRSTRDGFACHAADLAQPIHVRGLVRAGESYASGLAPGDAVEIMTGAPVPDGADAVLMVEHVLRDGDQVTLAPGRSLAPGDNIVPAGAEARAGATIVEPGTRIRPAQIAAAAMCGYPELEVRTRPRVAVLSTGDELVEVGEQPLPHQIRNSNTHSLSAQIAEAGGEPVPFPPVRDEPARLEAAIRSALADSDLLLLSGGVSMGKYDFVEEVLLSLGAEFFFTGAKIQPGKPVVFGRIPLGEETRYFFGLPGNPVSTMVTFLLFVAPVLGALSSEDAGPRFVLAQTADPVRPTPGLTRFLPARLTSDVAAPTARILPWQGSGDLAATARADCFMVIPGTSPNPIRAGDPITLLLTH